MKLNLNGWQRLWVVAAVLWAVPVFFVTWSNWPTAQNVPEEDVYKRINSADARPLADAATADVAGKLRLSDEEVTTLARGASKEQIQSVLPKMTPDERAQFKRIYDGLQMVLRVKREAVAGEAFASWAVIAAVCYALGWAVAWIRRGFAGSR